MSPRAALALFFCLSATMASAQDWPQWRGPNRDGHSPDTNLELDWNEKSPRLLWMVEGTGSGYASVSIANGMIYTTGNKDGAQCAIAMSLKDGKPLWTRKLTEENPNHGYPGSRCTPSVDGDRVYVITSDGSIACLDATNGKIKWSKVQAVERLNDVWLGLLRIPAGRRRLGSLHSRRSGRHDRRAKQNDR